MLLLLIKSSLCIAGTAICLFSLRRHWWAGLDLRLLFAIGFTWRYVLFFGWFGAMGGHVSGDVSGYDMHTRWVLDGQIPNQDFETPYGFYLNYLNAALYQVWASPVMLVVAYQLAELAGIVFLSAQLARDFGADFARKFVLLYCFNPIVISWFAFDGQEELLTIPLVAALVWAYRHRLHAVLGAVAAVMVLLVKVTSLTLWAPFVLLAGRRAMAWTAGWGVALALPAVLLGSQVFSTNFTREQGGDALAERIFPGNMWYVLENIDRSLDFGSLPLILLAILLAVTGLVLLRSGLRDVTLPRAAAAAAAFSLAFQITSPYTSPGFLAIAVPFLLIVLLAGGQRRGAPGWWAAAFVLWSLIAALDIPFYFRFDALRAYELGQTGGFVLGDAFLVWQVLLVVANMAVFILLLSRVVQTDPDS